MRTFIPTILVLQGALGFVVKQASHPLAPGCCRMVAVSPLEAAVPETKAPSPYSFAGLVEQRILERFGDGAQRVVESWRLNDMDYEHRQFVGDQQSPPVTDPERSNCHQLAHSFVPDLPAVTFWDESQYEWCQKLRLKYKDIRREFDQAMSNMQKLEKMGNNIWAGALTDDASSYGTGWRTLVLMNRGMWDAENVNLFPRTAKAVRDAGVPAAEVFFASMKPNSDIKMHSDFTNFVLTSHLAIDIPESGSNKCRLTVGDDTREWINGDVMLFDTSIMHDAINESDKTRYILMMRVWHPDLTEIERQALQFVYDCLEFPELVSDDIDTRTKAEQQVEAMRSFPAIAQASGFGGGAKSKKKVKGKKKR